MALTASKVRQDIYSGPTAMCAAHHVDGRDVTML